MKEIDEYINNKSLKGIDEVGGVVDVAAIQVSKKKRKKDVLEVIDHELIRKREELARVAKVDGLESYIGKFFSAEQINNMEKENLEPYYQLYQLKAGQEATNEVMTSLVEASVMGLSYVVDIDNKEELKNDLLNIKSLRRMIGRYSVEITEKYGDFITYANVFSTVKKHLLIPPKEDVGANPSLETPSPSTIQPPDDEF